MLTTVYTLHQTLSTTNVCFGGPILQKKETEKLSLQRYLYKVKHIDKWMDGQMDRWMDGWTSR